MDSEKHIAPEEFTRRLTLIKSSMLGAYLSSSTKNPISLYQIVNRAFLMTQMPGCVAIYKKSFEKKSNGKSVVSYVYRDIDFISEKQHRKIYLDKLSEYHTKNKNHNDYRIPKKHKVINHLIPIYDTGYYFLVFTITPKYKGTSRRPIFKLVKKPENNSSKINCYDYIYKSFCKLFSLTNENEITNDALSKFTEKSINNFHICEEYDESIFHENTEYLTKDVARKYLEQVEVKRDSVFDLMYQKFKGFPSGILKNVVAENSFYDVPNIIFFTREYNRAEPRCNNENSEKYPYNIRIVLPKKQEADLREFFAEIIDSYKKEEGRFNVNMSKIEKIQSTYSMKGNLYSRYANNIGCSGAIKGFIKLLDSKFWGILLSEKGIDKIVEIIKSPVGGNSRSFTDSVFSSGVIHYRNPFDMGGIERVTSVDSYEVFDNEASDADDYLRMVSVHYLLDSMAPLKASDDKKMLLALFPLEVSGKISSVVGHVVYVDNPNSYVKSKEWDSIYYFYHYVAAKLERALRKDLLRIYVEIVFRDFQKRFVGLAMQRAIVKNIKSIGIEDVERITNEANIFSDDLSRFSPFNTIRFSVSEYYDIDSLDGQNLIMLGALQITVTQSRNNYYPLAISKKEEDNLGVYLMNSSDLHTIANQYIKRIESEIVQLSSYVTETNP